MNITQFSIDYHSTNNNNSFPSRFLFKLFEIMKTNRISLKQSSLVCRLWNDIVHQSLQAPPPVSRRNIAIFTVPFQGHFDVLYRAAKVWQNVWNVKFVVCGWPNLGFPRQPERGFNSLLNPLCGCLNYEFAGDEAADFAGFEFEVEGAIVVDGVEAAFPDGTVIVEAHFLSGIKGHLISVGIEEGMKASVNELEDVFDEALLEKVEDGFDIESCAFFNKEGGGGAVDFL